MAPVLAKRVAADRSFERLYRKHAGDVYRYALVVLRNQADAEDVTQTTFMNAYRAMESGERPRSPQNWLIAIAHNVCRQRFRQSQRRPNEVAFEEELAEAVVDEDAISAEDIRRALGHLAFNQRSALVMRELEGRSYQEIAEILGTTVGAVETLIFRARRALREQLEEGITCHEAELAISRQLDGRLSRKEKGALRAHLRECEECSGFARSQRAQRGALKSLGAIPLPGSLVGLFGGSGGTAAVGGGLAIKAAAVAAGAMIATGVSYEGVKHGVLRHTRPAAAPVAATKHQQPARPAARPTPKPSAPKAAFVVAPRQEAKQDEKPFRRASVKVRKKIHHDHASAVAVAARAHPAHPAHPATPARVSAASSTHGRSHQAKPANTHRAQPQKQKQTPKPHRTTKPHKTTPTASHRHKAPAPKPPKTHDTTPPAHGKNGDAPPPGQSAEAHGKSAG